MYNKVAYNHELLGGLGENPIILLDTCVLVDASKSEGFLHFLIDGLSEKAAFATIQSVQYEFMRGAKDLRQWSKHEEFISNLNIEMLPNAENMTRREKAKTFLAIYNKCLLGDKAKNEKGPSYTDSLICLASYMYNNSNIWLMTANYKDVPLRIFDRKYVISIDMDKEVRTESLYKFNEEKFEREAKNFLKG